MKITKKHFFLSSFLISSLLPFQSIAHVPPQNTAKYLVGNHKVRGQGIICNLTLYDVKIENNYYFYSDCPFLKKYSFWNSYGYTITFENSNSKLSFLIKENGFASYPDGNFTINHKTDLSFLQKLYAKLRS